MSSGDERSEVRLERWVRRQATTEKDMDEKIDTRGMSDGEIYESVSRRANPEAHAKIDALIASLPQERECCGTFPRTPHRSTCAKYRGKFKPSNAEVSGRPSGRSA